MERFCAFFVEQFLVCTYLGRVNCLTAALCQPRYGSFVVVKEQKETGTELQIGEPFVLEQPIKARHVLPELLLEHIPFGLIGDGMILRELRLLGKGLHYLALLEISQ